MNKAEQLIEQVAESFADISIGYGLERLPDSMVRGYACVECPTGSVNRFLYTDQKLPTTSAEFRKFNIQRIWCKYHAKRFFG